MSGIAPVVVVHGGAGAVSAAKRPVHAEGCKKAAEAGLAKLMKTGDPVAAVVVAVRVLESDPLFNAGIGACLTEAETLELDASIMEGTSCSFGAVTCLPPFEHPIAIADEIRRAGGHTFFAGAGAARFAERAGFERSSLERMVTSAARERLKAVLAGRAEAAWAGSTVGAVACSSTGALAAGTSTGGTVGKLVGRVGDTPLPGAGTWADDRQGACSTTGMGEPIMRYGLAMRAASLLTSGIPAQPAAEAAIAGFRERVAGSGGLILVGPRGDVGVSRNTDTMSFAVAQAGLGARFGF